MMKVLFDSAIMAQQEFGGVSKYFIEMSDRLGLFGVDHRIYAPLFINRQLRDLRGRQTFGLGVEATRINRKLASTLGRATLPAASMLYRPDVIHQTLYDMQRTRRSGPPTVITIHDMIQELFPDEFPDGGWVERKRRAIADAAWIICDSRNTERDLLRFYPEASGRTSVVHLAARSSDQPLASPPPEQPEADPPFLLYVGHRGGYKNFAGLLDAYSTSDVLRRELTIVCVGGGSFSAAEKAALNARGVADRVKHVRVSDEELNSLYRSTAVFVYPSLYEGFGIPPLEAMAVGCPVVALNQGSVPEICGDAAHYAGSAHPDSLREAIEQVVESTALRDRLIANGRVRVTMFSWEKCAEQTAAVYRHVVESRR